MSMLCRDGGGEAGRCIASAHATPLPFRVRPAELADDLRHVQRVRELAYGRHVGQHAASFGLPDPLDHNADATVLLAEDRASREVVGSARIQLNRRGPLEIERSVTLPKRLDGRLLCEVTRLCVMPGYCSRLVRPALVKACYLRITALRVSGVVAGSRCSLLRLYRALGFDDLFGDAREVPLAHGGGLPHRVLWLDLLEPESVRDVVQGPMHAFVFRDWHPDIEPFGGKQQLSAALI